MKYVVLEDLRSYCLYYNGLISKLDVDGKRDN